MFLECNSNVLAINIFKFHNNKEGGSVQSWG